MTSDPEILARLDRVEAALQEQNRLLRKSVPVLSAFRRGSDAEKEFLADRRRRSARGVAMLIRKGIAK